MAARYRADLDEQAASAMCSEVTLTVVSAGGRPGLTHFPAFDNRESCGHKHGEGERSEQQN
ncbi:MAG: hypothetical protein LC799_24480 [Actinobacteria bacterium]|nr:hypothetical protein [Actinomycetota bacterium]